MTETQEIQHQCATCGFWVEAWRIEHSVCWQENKTKNTLPHDTCEQWTDSKNAIELL